MPTRPDRPYLVVDAAVLDRNLRRPARLAPGVAVRPHVKTHKCVEIARRQVAAGAVGITVATLGEAEVFVAAGLDDVFVAFPLWPDERTVARLRGLLASARVRVGLATPEAVAPLAALAGSGLELLVEVDSGHHRTGVAAADAGRLAATAVAAGLDVVGVFTFPGHAYGPDRAAAAADEARALGAAAASLRAAGVEPRVVSGGSTPSLDAGDPAVLTETRPGVYVLNDAQQWELGSATPDDVALWAEAVVVQAGPDRAVLAVGSKLLGADRPAWASGFGRLLDHHDARVTALSEHHATVEGPGLDLRPGEVVRVVPNHVCTAVNLVDVLHVRGPEGDTTWAVDARGRNA